MTIAQRSLQLLKDALPAFRQKLLLLGLIVTCQAQLFSSQGVREHMLSMLLILHGVLRSCVLQAEVGASC